MQVFPIMVDKKSLLKGAKILLNLAKFMSSYSAAKDRENTHFYVMIKKVYILYTRSVCCNFKFIVVTTSIRHSFDTNQHR